MHICLEESWVILVLIEREKIVETEMRKDWAIGD